MFNRACAMTRGGAQGAIFAANKGEIESVTESGGIVTTIVMKDNPAIVGQKFHWYQIMPKKDTAGFDNVVVKGTNSRYYNQTIDFAVEGIGTESKQAFNSLINGQAVFIVKDWTGVSHLMGYKNGAEIQDGARIGAGVDVDSLVGAEMQFLATDVDVMQTVAVGQTIEVLNVDGSTIDTVTID